MTASQSPVQICPTCLMTLHPDASQYRCPGCADSYHLECWEYLGGCARYGCTHMREVLKQQHPEAPRARCPMCAEPVHADEQVCPYCDYHIIGVILTVKKEARPLLRIATCLFALSVIGVTSPLVLVFGGAWVWLKRRAISEDGSPTRALAVGALLIAALYLSLVGTGYAVFQFMHESGS